MYKEFEFRLNPPFRSEMNNVSNPSSPHAIEGKRVTIRHIDDKEKRKYLKWRENLIGKK